MISYKDKTFCMCENPQCSRYLSPEDKAEAERLELPIAFAYFHPLKQGK